MSHEPPTEDVVALTRRILDAWNSGDLDAWARHYSPGVTVDSRHGVVLRGRESFRAYQAEWRANYREIVMTAEELLDVGNGVVFGVCRQTARPVQASGVVTQLEPMIATVDEGLITRLVIYPQSQLDEARAAAERLATERASRMSARPTTTNLVERSQRFVDAINARDMDAAMTLYDSDAVWRPAGPGLEMAETFEGATAIRSFLEEWYDMLEDFELEAEELRDLGGGVTFGCFRLRGKPLGSSAPIEFSSATVASWSDGVVCETWNYLDVDEGRAAAERLAAERLAAERR